MRRLAWTILFAAACSSSSKTGNGHGDGGGDGGDGSAGGLGLVDVNVDGGVCAATSMAATRTPLDILLVVDTSYSMDYSLKWIEVEPALEHFFIDPRFASLEVGLQYFPLRAQCNIDDYAIPAVPIAPLSSASTALVNSVRSKRMSGGTPTVQVLEGTLPYLKTWAAAHPDHKTILILSTDGVPDDTCIEPTDAGLVNSLDNAVQLVQAAATSDPKVTVFVIGVGTELAALDAIAQAGGTGNALLIDTTQNVQQEFTDALASVSTTALNCEYSIPMPPDGSNIDYHDVNVSYTLNGVQQTFVYVGSAANCATAADHGWYYDDPANPTRVLFCGATCDRVKSTTSGEVDILYGCPVVIM
jgi:hypothetical protein